MIHTALGQLTADMIVTNGRILNVYTGELLEGLSIGIKGSKIAYVGKIPEGSRGDGTQIVDAQGGTIIPGFIDGHAHLAWLYQTHEFLRHAIPRGATTIITETMEVFPIMGYEGVRELLKSCARQPIKIFATAPAMVSISKKVRGIPREILAKLLRREDILGLGESYWQAILQEPERFLPLFSQTQRRGKSLEGHSAGARGEKLMAYVAAGISSCHEPINMEEVRERLRLGLYVMVREGSIRRDLAAIAPIKDASIDLRRLILVSDGVEPVDLLERGHMDSIVQKAIDCGFPPAQAVQMATLNVAEHFSLAHLIGGIAPGRYADLLIIPDLAKIEPRCVISNGRMVAEEGKCLVPPRKHAFSRKSRQSVQLPRPATAGDFQVRAADPVPEARVRVIDQITDLVTKEIVLALPVVNGEIRQDLNRDILKVAAIDRTHNPGECFVGFIRGFQLKRGALASSASWDTSDIIIVGADDADMAAAVRRIHDLQGGSAICAEGKILAEVAHPVFGLLSDAEIGVLAQDLAHFTETAHLLGIPFPNPLLTLITLTGAAIPYLRICEEGLVNLKDGITKGLFIE
ncbi:MAG: adenine deaminase C-terminal domain-containing protein [Smithellaceae bacterium]|nr:adenine deaminase C-terminal domain-containing protein [Smithellaceae bacterium]